MKANVVVLDPPWVFSDKLLQSSVKRGAESNYSIMTDQDIINLDIKNITADDSVLVLWVPGSKLDIGLECCKNWGFKATQTWIWVKTKQNPLSLLIKPIIKIIKKEKKENYISLISQNLSQFNINNILNFFMGHCFRQTHELALVATRGRYKKLIKNKAQRSVFIGPALGKHSEKPEELQDRLDIMFGNVNKVELFARRDRKDWYCFGNECPSSYDEDIKVSIEKIKKI